MEQEHAKNQLEKISQWRKRIIEDKDEFIKYLANPIYEGWICIYRQTSNLQLFSTIINNKHEDILIKRLPDRGMHLSCLKSDSGCKEGCKEYTLVYQRHRNTNLSSLPADPPVLNPILYDLHHDSIFSDNKSELNTLTYLNSLGELNDFMIISDDIAIVNFKHLEEFLKRYDYTLFMYFNNRINQLPNTLMNNPSLKKDKGHVIYREYKNGDGSLIFLEGGRIMKPTTHKHAPLSL